MGPEKKTFWLPRPLLGAFFVTVVMAGNVLFHDFRPPTASVPPDSQESVDWFASRKKHLERRFSHLLEELVEAPASAPSAGEDERDAGVPCPAPSTLTFPDPDRTSPKGSAVENLGTLGPGPVPFIWPAPLVQEPESGLPISMSLGEWSDFRAQLVTDLYRDCGAEPAADVGDALLTGPELVMDGLFICIGSLSPRSRLRTWEDEENRSITARMLDVQFAPRKQRLSTVLLLHWTESEKKYLGSFGESRANTFGFENQTEEADLHELALDQRKVFFDAVRRTYLARYKIHSEEQIRDEAWYFDRWSGLDFALLPPFIGAYLFYRGFNKKIPMGDLTLRIDLEPISEFTHRHHDRPVAAALEWTVRGFPVGVIVSAGIYKGRYGLDFAGIGTSIGAARGAVQAEHDAVSR